LIVAEHAVEVSRLKVDRIESQLSKLKDSDQAEDLEYELRLAELALDQARKLLEQKHRWIAAQRNSDVVNIRYLEKSVALAESEFLLMIETLKKAPGSVATAEGRRQQLEIQKAKLRLEQAEADLDVFEVENRTSRNSGTPLQRIEDSRSFRKPVIDEPQPVSRNRAVDDSIDGDFLDEPGIALPETSVPTESLKPSSPPETPTVVPEPDSNPVRSS
jgi:hypothetical protein